MQSPSFQIQTFCGTVDGWQPASPAVVSAETAARRLDLYRAVRGEARLYRIAPVILPGESAAMVASLPGRATSGAVLPSFI
jgi:hypothetical protein